MAEVLGLFDRRKQIQVFLIKPAIALERIDCKITYAKRGQVLEEMRTLARIDPIIFQTALYDYPSITDMRPLDRNTQPRITTSPTPGPYEDISLVGTGELPVHLFYIVSHQLIVGSVKRSAFHINNVLYIIDNAISQHISGREDSFLLRNDRQVLFHYLLVIHNRTDLKQIESRFMRIGPIHVHGKFYLDRPSHFPLADLQKLVQGIGKRKNIMLQDIHKREDLTSARIISVPDNHVIRIIGRYDILQCPVGIRIFQGKTLEVKSIIHREMVTQAHISKVQRIETSLRLTQGEIRGAHLQNTMRMAWRETQGKTSVHNIFTQSQRDIGYAILGFLVSDRIKVQ